MKQFMILISCCLAAVAGRSQELYVYTDPASNIPAKSLLVRAVALLPEGPYFRQRYEPSVAAGISKKLMLRASGSFSDFYSSNLRGEGGRLYAKYRFLSKDGVHRHFRMATFGSLAYSRNSRLYDEVNLDGDNSGWQAGVLATQLVHKLAVSASVAYGNVFVSSSTKVLIADPALQTLNYTLSAGYLIFPVKYANYQQTNVNLYAELLAQQALNKSAYAVDMAVAAQFIFHSNTRLNLGYRFQLSNNMRRMATHVWQVSVEHTLFNAWKG